MDGLLWLLVTLLPLLILQRKLQAEIMALFLLLTSQINISLVLFTIIFFPGVLIHELSHWLAATLVGVRTARLSLIPDLLPENKLRMGYVEMEQVDFVREAIIGVAPLLVGGLFVGYVGISRLKFHILWGIILHADSDILSDVIMHLETQSDFWLWFYLAFVVSSTMLPSASDRRAWLPVALFGCGLLVAALLTGAGTWLLENLATSLNNIMRAIAIVLIISAVTHLAFLFPITILRRLLAQLTRFKIVSEL